ncbi:putative extracelular serine carboxypeptidase [Jimgerdemannia flammicorona]|uniref:Putative extracelular serine carboxypeptidase n=1 Tax=Jimgerdemannia flammicorona TaxID=994334 RepID=A0A432ZYR2_9FUNG|nr:putative extracelular serine carboxypeptidase [Jimgerdemannia flammicorona]
MGSYNYGPFYFEQKINHFDNDSGTFKQRYWMNRNHYSDSGPAVLYNAGEVDAGERSYYVINSTMHDMARELHGIVIVIEHRYYGESMPFSDHSTENLRFLTTGQALADMAYFIRSYNVSLSWIIYGGSYSGNIAAWMRTEYPDLVFAAVASSAPVEIRPDFWKYYDPIMRYGPKHCIDAIVSTIEQVDEILFGNDSSAKTKLYSEFGLAALDQDDDFASWIRYPLSKWQNIVPWDNPFADFCTIFDGSIAPKDAYARYITSVNFTEQDYRAWLYQTCTEYGYWQIAAPINRTTIVSRKLDIGWFQRQCQNEFDINDQKIGRIYDGWNITTTRIIWVDGEWDPWRELSVQSPNANARDNAFTIPRAVHHWDLFSSAFVPNEVKIVQFEILEVLRVWLEQYRVYSV